MKHLILVSHGQFASGLHDALEMLAGKRDDVISVGLENGKTVDQFAVTITEAIQSIGSEEEVIVLADLIGGSPLTTMLEVLKTKGLLDSATIIGGMNLPLALTATLMKDTLSKEVFVETIIGEANMALKPFVIEADEEEDI